MLLVSFVVYRLFLEEHFERLSYAGLGFFPANTQRLHQFAERQAGDYRLHVISLGTSLTRYATYPEIDNISQESKLAHHADINLLNISRPAGLFIDFTPLLQEVIGAHPDVVIVQSDLLRRAINRKKAYETREILHLLFEQWVGNMHLSEYTQQNDPIRLELKHQGNRNPLGNGDVVNTKHSSYISEWYLEMLMLPPEFLEFVSLAQEQKIQIVVLHISRQYLFEQHYAQPLREWKRNLQILLTPFKQIPLWVSPHNWNKKDYYDYSHLNGLGREKFMNWFLPQLRDIAGEMSPE